MSANHSPQTASQRIAWIATIVASTLVFIFLMAPILAIVPLSFSSSTYLTYPLPGLSLRWYEEFLNSARWMNSLKNSFIIGVSSALLSMALGTLASLGLAQWKSKWKPLVLAVVLSPMVVPVVITAVGVYFFFAPLGLTGNYLGLILVHTALATPFVVITVSATLQSFDMTLARAARRRSTGRESVGVAQTPATTRLTSRCASSTIASRCAWLVKLSAYSL